jgi:hypothetical protein
MKIQRTQKAGPLIKSFTALTSSSTLSGRAGRTQRNQPDGEQRGGFQTQCHA